MSRRGLKAVALSVVLGGTAVLLSGCSWSEAIGLGWPEGITPDSRPLLGPVPGVPGFWVAAGLSHDPPVPFYRTLHKKLVRDYL